MRGVGSAQTQRGDSAVSGGSGRDEGGKKHTTSPESTFTEHLLGDWPQGVTEEYREPSVCLRR